MDPWLENFARANFQRSADTAHDLKTPLNVAVLNLELLRMRLQKVCEEGDEKLVAYTHAIEMELRRLGHIFDAYFLLSTPPKNGDAPALLDVIPICAEAASSAGIALQTNGNAFVLGHEARIREAYKLFFEGSSKVLAERSAAAILDGAHYTVTLAGASAAPDVEPAKLFKLYYTDAEGTPELSLAVARLIVETYGGALNAQLDRDNVILRLSLPLGEQ